MDGRNPKPAWKCTSYIASWCWQTRCHTVWHIEMRRLSIDMHSFITRLPNLQYWMAWRWRRRSAANLLSVACISNELSLAKLNGDDVADCVRRKWAQPGRAHVSGSWSAVCTWSFCVAPHAQCLDGQRAQRSQRYRASLRIALKFLSLWFPQVG